MSRIFSISMAAALSIAAPAAAQTAVSAATADDPTALGEARAIAVKLLPPRTYKRLMSTAMGQLMDSMGDSIGALPVKQLAQLGGLDAKQAAVLDKVDLAPIMAIYDPRWQERSKLQMHAMTSAMGDFFDTMKPELRDAYARALVHTFTLDELKDLGRYFTTPTGAKFAARYMSMATDPAIMDVTKSMMPKIIAQMPRFVDVAQKATASLPPAPRIEDLTPQQRSELAKALGVPEGKLGDPGARQ